MPEQEIIGDNVVTTTVTETPLVDFIRLKQIEL